MAKNKNKILKEIMGALALPWTALSSQALFMLISRVMALKAKQLQPAESLKLLLSIENTLYDLEGTHSVRYGKGIHTKHRHTSYHRFFIEHVGPDDTILDIECGNGALAHDIATNRPGTRITGIDLNSKNIKKATTSFPAHNVSYMCGNILDEKAISTQHFDTVILSNVLEHLPGRANFLRKIQEKFSPRQILIRVPLFERDWRVPLKKELGVEWRLDSTHETEYTHESWNEELQAAGLESVQQEIRWGEIWAVAVAKNS